MSETPDIPPEVEAQMYNAAAEAMAPFVGRNVNKRLLNTLKKRLEKALTPFAALDEVPEFEVVLIQNPDNHQQLLVRFERVNHEAE
jgi:hypothetical protein